MNLKFCGKHDQELIYELSRRGLSEIGWQTNEEREQALIEQKAGHGSQRNFNPYIESLLAISMKVGKQLGDKAEGCPVCLLGSETTIIQDAATKITAYIKALPEE